MRVTASVIVPTFNEAGNIAELVGRLGAVLDDHDTEIIFVDDSTDDTPDVIREVARTSAVPVRLIHRAPGERVGGLGGAVFAGFQASSADWFVVMDGDLQHPPEMVPVLLARAGKDDGDVVVASRYCGGGEASGLSGTMRHLVSNGATALTRGMFPRRLRNCTDPMTGFFAVRADALDLATLRPRGFKILLEILARRQMRVVEEPFSFGERFAGESKANVRQGLHFLHQLASLRFGRMSRFAGVGAIGTVINLALMAVLLSTGSHYLTAAIIATEVTILSNFLLQERFVFRDLRDEVGPFHVRLLQSVAFNNVEALVRIPVLVALVEWASVPGLQAQAICLALAFVARFLFVSRVVYRPGVTAVVAGVSIEEADRAHGSMGLS
jgi:dolichol-phosphate mannosyltransferase